MNEDMIDKSGGVLDTLAHLYRDTRAAEVPMEAYMLALATHVATLCQFQKDPHAARIAFVAALEAAGCEAARMRLGVPP